MKQFYPFLNKIDLHVQGRISAEDARRQEKTAREILVRLKHQPGVVLADEVGMGKTFVALAVAVSVALTNPKRRPVVVMVPPSLQEKWPQDFSLFVSRCLPENIRKKIRCGIATCAEEFLKMLDDPLRRRRSVIFITHGAMSRGLSDKWVKLALIRQALFHRYRIGRLKHDLFKNLGYLLRFKWMDYRYGSDFWENLLKRQPKDWLQVLHKWHIDPEDDSDSKTDDDPVPKAVCDVLKSLSKKKTRALFRILEKIPKKQSKYFDERIQMAKNAIQDSLRPLWKECIQRARLRLPLLILDEAHHLKNEDTRLASLFRCQEASDDIEAVHRGALSGVFERMLFLTATPFQLGHDELCCVLERFKGVAWKSNSSISYNKSEFDEKIALLRKVLDTAQEAALRLDEAWGRLGQEHLVINDEKFSDPEAWWSTVQKSLNNNSEVERVIRGFREVKEKMQEAENQLRPWIIRHLKSRQLPAPNHRFPRRIKLQGRAIASNRPEAEIKGLDVEGEALVPFLLSARAAAFSAQSRSLFAEGLASSYEAFLHTREARKAREGCGIMDTDDDESRDIRGDRELRWYIEKLETFVPKNDPKASKSHPKVAATVQRVVDTWRRGEKILVFCHFIATGKTLRLAISYAVQEEILRLGAEKLGSSPAQVFKKLDSLGKRFFDEESPIRHACDKAVHKIIKSYPGLKERSDDLIDAVRRVVRTPSFLVRFFPLQGGRLREKDMLAALNRLDQSGMTLRGMLKDFFEFLQNRCDDKSRAEFIEAVGSIQTGYLAGRSNKDIFFDDELQGEDARKLLPNVRLVNGTTSRETRNKLMLAFNTPFFPEILVASSVLAEGVDLHLNCRHVIHHDLCWNPSTMEQRTGRIDRIGAKAERCGKSIYVYLPYINQTQDEKMFRVVMDRERWFSVIMGEKYDLNERATEKIAGRIPLPESAARNLALRLEVK